jgi:two-component sensor histidine kinase
VTSLLHMHGLSASEPADLAQLTGQINSIAATYDVIHRTGGVETVDFGKILSELCRNIADAHGRLVAMTSTVTGECVVTADTAVALSLALNELITNSIKHAAAGREAAVVVSCRQDGGNLLIEISDDGPGFPPGFDVSRVQGFGMRMALNLVEQAGGRILIPRSDQGALVQVTTPLAQPA